MNQDNGGEYCAEDRQKRAERTRTKLVQVIGRVVKAAGPHKWEVIFDYDTKVKTISLRSLTIVETDAGIPLDKEGAVDITPNVSIDACTFCYLHRTISSLISFLIEYHSAGFSNCID